MTKRYVKKGSKNYGPDYKLDVRRTKGDFIHDRVRLAIPKDMYFDPEEYRHGSSWLKAGGRSYFSLFKPGTIDKSKHSAILGFRPKKDKPGMFEAVAYTNHPEVSYSNSEGHTPITFSAMEYGGWVEMDIWTFDDKVEYSLRNNAGEEIKTVHPFERLCYSLTISPHHGGQQPAITSHYIRSEMTNFGPIYIPKTNGIILEAQKNPAIITAILAGLAQLLPIFFKPKTQVEKDKKEINDAIKRYQKWLTKEDIGIDLYNYLMKTIHEVIFYSIPPAEIMK